MTEKSFAALFLIVSEEQSEELPWTLQDLGAVAVETRDSTTMSSSGGNGVLHIAGFDNSESRDRAKVALERSFPDVEISASDICDDGWSTGWRKFFQPVVLETLQVITPWMDPPDPSKKVLEIDPGQAFGTGGHATTCLVLQMLEDRAQRGVLPKCVFDVGAGSGILSIAAVMLGASSAEGIDIEQESVDAVFENAARNNVEGQVTASLNSPDNVQGKWPLVLANIQLAVFKEYSASIAELIGEGGEVLLSGLLEEQVDELVGLWPGFEVSELRSDKGWVALSLQRDLHSASKREK